MKLNVVSRDLDQTFNEQVGISVERSNALSDMLDEIAKKYVAKGSGRTVDIFSDIVAICNNVEEVVYCTINHCNWAMINHGFIYCPTQKKEKKDATKSRDQ